MPRCELTGKGPTVAHKVSHSNIKTKTIKHPNIQQKKLFSATLGKLVSLKLASSTIKTIEHNGGLDSFILKQPIQNLSLRARKVRTQLLRKLHGKSPTTKPGKGTEQGAQ